MRIQDKILNPFVIDVDSDQFTLLKQGKTEKGDDKETIIGYYSTLPSALHKVAKEMAQTDKTVTLSEYIDNYNSIVEKLLNSVKEVK